MPDEEERVIGQPRSPSVKASSYGHSHSPEHMKLTPFNTLCIGSNEKNLTENMHVTNIHCALSSQDSCPHQDSLAELQAYLTMGTPSTDSAYVATDTLGPP